MPTTKRLSWNSETDWATGEFGNTNTANPPGSLSIGWPEKPTGIEKFVYRFNALSGSSIVNDVDERQSASITGSYTWKTTDSGVRYLRLNGGQVSLPVSSQWGVTTYTLGITFRVTEYPPSDMLLVGKPNTTLGMYLTNSGRIKVPNAPGKEPSVSKKKVPKNTVLSATLVLVAQSGRFLGFYAILNGTPMAAVQNEVNIFRINNSFFQIGPGKLDVFAAYFLEGDYKDQLVPFKEGVWESAIENINDIERLSAISVDGHISKNHRVQITVIMSEAENMSMAEGTKFDCAEPTTFMVPEMVHGQYVKTRVELATTVPEDPPVISSLALHFGDFPFIAPIYVPIVPVPDDDIRVTAVPRQDDMVVKADQVSGKPYVRTTAKETEIQAAAGGGEFSRLLRPMKGWSSFGGQSNRSHISQYSCKPPLWFAGYLSAPTEIYGQPLVSEKGTIIAHGICDFFAWDGTGQELWAYRSPYQIAGEGVIFDNYFVFPSKTNVQCLDVRDGSLVWVYEPESNPSGSIALLESGHILVPLADGSLDFLTKYGTLVKNVDTGYGSGLHVDQAYSDSPYSESYHVDYAAKNVPHVDQTHYEDWTDSYSAGGHYEVSIYHLDGHNDHSQYPIHADVSEHSDVPHTNVSHGDTPHSDTNHIDEPYIDIDAPESGGRGVILTDEGFNRDNLLVFPTFCLVLNKSDAVSTVILPKELISAAVMNDEVAESVGSIRLVHVGTTDGTLSTFSAETGALLFSRELDSEVKFIVNSPIKNIPLLVGTKNKIYLLEQDLETIWEYDIDSSPVGWPVVAQDSILIPLQKKLICLSFEGLSLGEAEPGFDLTGSVTTMKQGTALVPTERGIAVYKSYDASPFIAYDVWPEIVHCDEWFYLIDKSSEVFGQIPRVSWLAQAKQMDESIAKLRISHAGVYEIQHLAANDVGQQSGEKFKLRIYPSFMEERPLRWKIESQVTKRVTITIRSEDEMRIFYPGEGINEVYQDQPLQVDLEVFGDYKDITGATVVFKMKAEEKETAPVLLSITGSLVEPEEGRAKIEISPSDWKSVDPGTYYWGIYITYTSGRVELAGRGRLELRAALA